jgi:hypothetical protein
MSGFNSLSPKEQFALILMASAALYKRLYNYDSLNEPLKVSSSNVQLRLDSQSFNLDVCRRNSNLLYSNFLVTSKFAESNDLYISMEYYRRGTTLSLFETTSNKINVETYLAFVKNFQDDILPKTIKAVYSCFEQLGYYADFSYFLGTAYELYELKR